MKELMQAILATHDKGLIDEVLLGIVIHTYDGVDLKYVGNGMAKNSQGTLVDLAVDSIESFAVGEIPKRQTPVLSTADMPNGKPLVTEPEAPKPEAPKPEKPLFKV